jgi:glycosyltransferase 2 family protein
VEGDASGTPDTESPPVTRWRPGPLLRLGVSLSLLAFLVWALDAGALLGRLVRMDPRWAAVAVSLSLAQIALLAWRWRFTAQRLGLPLPFRSALEEYWLGIFLNQVLPGGILGDVSRAWRQARGGTATGSAVRGVILERASAQVVMTGVALFSALVLLLGPRGTGPLLLGAGTALLFTLGTGLFLLRGIRPLPARDSLAGRIRGDAHTAVLAPGAFLFHLVTGLLMVASYIAVFVAAARAVGVETPLLHLLPLVAPVLMTMLIPLSVAGWGLREGAAALLWGGVGLAAADGVLVSIAYGVLVLVSSFPGGIVLLRGPRG